MGNMTKKMEGHPLYAPGEEVVEAVYGLGKGMLTQADGAAYGLGRAAGLFKPRSGYAAEHERAVEGKDGFGFAAGVDGNGVLALTTQRLLFLKKATVVGRPKNITVEVPLDQLAAAGFERPMVSVAFTDGSICGLHVPRNQQPAAFVDAVNQAAGG